LSKPRLCRWRQISTLTPGLSPPTTSFDWWQRPQKERYLYPTLRGEKRGCFALTEPSGGSDPARAIQTKGHQDGDQWILNGSKLYISSADKADFALVFARTSDDPGRNGVTAFIVDTDTYRELRIRRVGEGPSEVQRLIMAREILGGSFK